MLILIRYIDLLNKEIRETLNNFNEIHIFLDNKHIIKFAKTETILPLMTSKADC